ncbi:hypothetical protein GOARA_061_00750 [Gordonia araii NBRC 100433]|uniref:DUF3499 domain-containing protein n=1 Tax=Gordonia araii NBRC 100433 TaxID=1073574 RepID=G7H461_9ACTN|nr:hypothetical protein GOARA_061_00750 [Gordonia araii NBRC 100433]
MATLTYDYAGSTAVIGPLARASEPHSWDLCAEHADRITVPRGWEIMRSVSGFGAPPEEQELTALAEAVRESVAVGSEPLDGFDDLPPRPSVAPSRREAATSTRPRPGRRGHLRVLPDVD